MEEGFGNTLNSSAGSILYPSGPFSAYDSFPDCKAFETVDLTTPAALAASPADKYIGFPTVRGGVLETVRENA